MNAETIPESIVMKKIPGGTFIMGSNSLQGSPTQRTDAPEHQVTLSPYWMSEAEVTNAQYTEFLNAAYRAGLIQIVTGSRGPDNGKRLVQGTPTSTYNGKTFYNLDGTRVLKDHDNADGDNSSFTGDVEPENPLNISYIDFDSEQEIFYVKDPHYSTDCNWLDICNYYDYGTTPRQLTGSMLNDFDDWAGGGANFVNELEGWTLSNPSAAQNLPTQIEVSNWPVTFIRWWGAQAFAEFYGLRLPTEAQWEFAAKGGASFTWAVHDGQDRTDANWNKLGMGTASTGHVRTAVSGKPNPFGLYNLGGNAWEWIADNYVESYDTQPVENPLVEAVGSTTRCWRGGSWNYHEATLQSSIRFSDDETHGNDHFGFRVVAPFVKILSFMSGDGHNEVSWHSMKKEVYGVEYSLNLIHWGEITEVEATGLTAVYSDIDSTRLSSSKGFYRIKIK
jgi:formylglycine-generating enzyme required for sulfatase activity